MQMASPDPEDEEQRALILVIDNFVKKALVEKAMGKKSGNQAAQLAARGGSARSRRR